VDRRLGRPRDRPDARGRAKFNIAIVCHRVGTYPPIGLALPTENARVAEPDVFQRQAAGGRCAFNLQDVVRLVGIVARLKKQSASAKENYVAKFK
jgi:hypothetical protein